MNTDYQLFAVQPTATVELTPGITAAVYSKSAVQQEVRDPFTNKINEQETNKLSEEISNIISDQLELTKPNVSLYPIGTEASLNNSPYARQLLLKLKTHLFNIADDMLFLRVDHSLAQC